MMSSRQSTSASASNRVSISKAAVDSASAVPSSSKPVPPEGIDWHVYYKGCTGGSPPESEFLRMLVAKALVLLITTVYYFVPLSFLVLGGLLLFGSYFYRALAMTVLGLYGVLGVMPLSPSPYLRNHWSFRAVAEYFHFRYLSIHPILGEDGKVKADDGLLYTIDKTGKYLTKEEETNNRYICLYFPHGVIPLAPLCFASIFDSYLNPVLYGPTCIADAVLYMPLLRQIFGIFQTTSASFPAMVRALKTNNVAVMPGGIAEIFLTNKDEEKLFLQARKGICKLALTTGAQLLPIYNFGHTQMFSLTSLLPPSISRALHASIIAFWPLIPPRVPLTMVRGAPIPVTKTENPTKEEIEALHAKLCQEVENLFHQTKALVGPEWATKKLTIN